MTNLGIATDGQPSDNFATIPDTSILALSNSVTSSQPAFGLNRGDVFKIVQTDTITYAAPALDATTAQTVVHNLGYTPKVIAYKVDAVSDGSDLYNPLPYFVYGSTGSGGLLIDSITSVFATSNTLVFETTNSAAGGLGSQIKIKYYLLQEARN